MTPTTINSPAPKPNIIFSPEISVTVNDIKKGACGELGDALPEPQHRQRAASTEQPPMILNMAKQAQRPCQSERRSSGAARGDYEAFVPF